MNKIYCIISFLILTFPCWAGGNKDNNPQQQEILAVANETLPPTAPQYWTGDGKSGMSLGILVPESQNLNTDRAYLPSMVQGVLVANVSKYSAISVLDRVSLDKVIAETLDPTYEDNFDIVSLGHVAHVGNMMTGKIIQTSTGYTLQINVTDTTPNARTIASYSAACTVVELDNHTAIQKASLDLLAQMGVQLTDSAKNELNKVNSQQAITAQTALARGITAQKQGTEVAALSYFYQAAAFEPSLAEAVNRSSILAANISSGNIGEDARNDIQWRKDWVDRLTETEQFFNNYFDNFFRNTPSMPYTLFYTSDIKQVGEINYQNETLTLGGMEVFLNASQDWVQSVEPILRSMQESVQAVLNGLNATGRKQVWNLDAWPQQSSFNLQHFGTQNKTFSITAELVNSNNQVIGRQTFQMIGTYELSIPLPRRGKQTVRVSAVDRQTINFPNVKANDITDSLSIRIVTINGTAAETVARNGILQIKAIPKNIITDNYNLSFRFGEIIGYEITGYLGQAGSVRGALAIPDTFFDLPVISIGQRAFSQKYLISVTIPDSVTSIGDNAFSISGLTSITIPNSVTSIGDNAFSLNRLTSVTIPNSVTSIGKSAFSFNQLDFIIIPNSVTSIGDFAFSNNQLVSIIIPNNVTIGMQAFESDQLQSIRIGANVNVVSLRRGEFGSLKFDSFAHFYNTSGKKAGIYTFNNNRWSYSPR